MSKPQYNKTVSGMYTTKKGGFVSLKIDERTAEALQAAAASIGGKLLIKITSAESKAKFKNPDTAPDAFLEIMSSDSVAQFEKDNPRQKHSAKEVVGL